MKQYNVRVCDVNGNMFTTVVNFADFTINGDLCYATITNGEYSYLIAAFSKDGDVVCGNAISFSREKSSGDKYDECTMSSAEISLI